MSETAGRRIVFSEFIPLQVQLYDLVRREIMDGVWIGDLPFPGEKELAQRYNVSVITTRAVLDRLARESFIQRGRGRRTKVIYEPRSIDWQAPKSIFPLQDISPYEYEVLECFTGPAPMEACERFRLSPGSHLWQLKRLRRFEGRVHSVTHNAQLPALGEAHDPNALKTDTMAKLLSDQGIELATLERRIGVAIPPVDIAMKLGITIQEPTLLYSLCVQNSLGIIVEWLRIYIHPEEQLPLEVFDLKTRNWIAAPP